MKGKDAEQKVTRFGGLISSPDHELGCTAGTRPVELAFMPNTAAIAGAKAVEGQ